MKILSFTLKWPKLAEAKFTTFRYPYWKPGEDVQIFYRSRSPKREKLGEARIVTIEHVSLEYVHDSFLRKITDDEARADGFTDRADMVRWMKKSYGKRYTPVMDKLFIEWIWREEGAEIKVFVRDIASPLHDDPGVPHGT